MITDRQRVELGVPVDLLTKTMSKLQEFRTSQQGVVLSSLLAKVSGELVENLQPAAQRKHIARVNRETDKLTDYFVLGPSKTHLSALQRFNAALAFSNFVFKDGKLPIRGQISYMQLTAFVKAMVPETDETVEDRLITSTGMALLGVAMSNDLYRY